ncbi:hypothetical protein IAU60_000072 [Kwoniella sp. DSM 27419]
MPPSPGTIHSLPVKVLYSIDATPQSYVTVLHDRQDVYVHPGPPGYGSTADQGPVGSCSLKSVARGICFASPECIPNATNLDFSVYNAEPSGRHAASARAFPSSPGDSSSAWTGRGFLSWVLAEESNGSTLARGRLIREYEFSSTHFAPEGGLEGLMAAAQAAADGTSEEADGKGWGLEIGISLRQLNPEGKVEFAGRREFEEMLAKGRSLSQSVTPSSPSRPAASTPASIPRSSPLVNSVSRLNGSTPTLSTVPRPGPSASSTGTARPPPTSTQSGNVPAHAGNGHPSRPSSSLSHRASSSSMPPSSLPALPSSSNAPSSRPSSSTGENPMPAPMAQPPTRPAPPSQQAESSRAAAQRSREVTPPPVARLKSPPPSTPSRAKLHALLRADGMMSPDLARHLASNPVLRNLLKAVPSNSNALSALRNITGINNPPNAVKKKEEEDDKDGSGDEATTPTPSAPPLPTPRTVRPVRNTEDGCCNCGTMVSSCWRTKKMKDGTPRKVCDDCGLYFNEHKRMRPPELWGQPHRNGASAAVPPAPASSSDTKRKHPRDPFTDGPAAGLRSSPRRNRSTSAQEPASHGIAQPNFHIASGIPPESPRKRQKTKPVPQPSPRMATRASAKGDAHGSHGPGSDFSAEAFGFSPNTIFGTSPAVPHDPSTTASVASSVAGVMSTLGGASASGIDPQAQAHGTGQEAVPGAGDDLDLTAFLNQMEGETDGFSLDSLFTGLGEGAGIELSQEMMDLIAGWENQIGPDGLLVDPGLGDAALNGGNGGGAGSGA